MIIPSDYPTANQNYRLVAYYKKTNPKTSTEAVKFFHSSINDEAQSKTCVGTEITVYDSQSFEEALEWVFGEYKDVLRNLAA